MFWVLICTVHLTVCSCHVTYAFQSKSTFYSFLNVKELFALSRCENWRWSDCNWTRTQDHLVLKRTINHLAKLAKWLSCLLSIYLYGAFDCMFLSCQEHTVVNWCNWFWWIDTSLLCNKRSSNDLLHKKQFSGLYIGSYPFLYNSSFYKTSK